MHYSNAKSYLRVNEPLVLGKVFQTSLTFESTARANLSGALIGWYLVMLRLNVVYAGCRTLKYRNFVKNFLRHELLPNETIPNVTTTNPENGENPE